jgi:hypothetical protein
MDLRRLLIAGILLAFSGQSPALFMPEEFTISTDTATTPSDGCGVSLDQIRDPAS